MHKLFRSRLAAVATGAVVVVGLGASGATATRAGNSDDARNNTAQAQGDNGSNGLKQRVEALEADGGPTGAMVQDFDRQPLLIAPGTAVASFPVEAGQSFVLTAKATLQNIEQESAEVDLDHGSCSLKDGDTVLDQTAVALGQDTGTGEVAFSSVTLTTLVGNDSDATKNVELWCFGGGEVDAATDDRSIADITITGVEVVSE